eukprot:4679939-Prymnesium_polylepis.1
MHEAACPPSTCYPATLHILASVRAPCPTRPQPPCLVPRVRMLNEPFMHLCRTYVKREVHALSVFGASVGIPKGECGVRVGWHGALSSSQTRPRGSEVNPPPGN